MSEEARKQALLDAAQALVDAVHEFVYPPDEDSRLRILGDYMKTTVGRDKLATSMLMPARLKAWGRNHRLSEEESRTLRAGQEWARGALDGYALLGQEITLDFYNKVIQGLVTRIETQMACKPAVSRPLEDSVDQEAYGKGFDSTPRLLYPAHACHIHTLHRQ